MSPAGSQLLSTAEGVLKVKSHACCRLGCGGNEWHEHRSLDTLRVATVVRHIKMLSVNHLAAHLDVNGEREWAAVCRPHVVPAAAQGVVVAIRELQLQALDRHPASPS